MLLAAAAAAAAACCWLCRQAGGGALPLSDLCTLMSTMDAYPGDVVVQDQGCAAIVALCTSAENRSNLVRLQAADKVFAALQRHDADTSLQVRRADTSCAGDVRFIVCTLVARSVCVCVCAARVRTHVPTTSFGRRLQGSCGGTPGLCNDIACDMVCTLLVACACTGDRLLRPAVPHHVQW
jgi:hypothetical protein